MKIIQALKQQKDLIKKAEDLQDKIAKHSAYLNFETPVYKDQRQQVDEWLQAHSDVLKELLRLRLAVQKTNLETPVTIELGGKSLTKSIAAWIHRRRDLSKIECAAWQKLTDRKLKEGKVNETTGNVLDVKIVRCYSPEKRDLMVEILEGESSVIDQHLEIVNAVTDLIE